MWLTEAPRSKALQALFDFAQGSRASWGMLLETAFSESSTFRELQVVLDAYSDNTLAYLSTSSQPLVHHRCHQLALQIWTRLVPLRKIRPVVFSWIRREQNLPGDFASKGVHDWRIQPDLFLAIDSVLHFTLDLFASECDESPAKAAQCRSPHSSNRTTPSATVARFPSIPQERLGSSHPFPSCVWPSPDANGLRLEAPSCYRYGHNQIELLPVAPDSITMDDVYGSSSTRLRLPPGSASRRCSSLHEGAVREELSRHALLLVLFNITVADATKVADLIGAQPPAL